MSKYTEPCPCCGQPKPRAPTYEERVRDTILEAFSKVLKIHECNTAACRNWPGTHTFAAHAMASLQEAGLLRVDSTEPVQIVGFIDEDGTYCDRRQSGLSDRDLLECEQFGHPILYAAPSGVYVRGYKDDPDQPPCVKSGGVNAPV